ncbi:hypothetical protein QMA09_13360, partial [Planococcus sp. APC 3906]
LASVSSSLEKELLLHRCASFVANEVLQTSLPAGPSAQALPAGVAAFRFIQRYFLFESYFFYRRTPKIHFLQFLLGSPDMEQNSGENRTAPAALCASSQSLACGAA